MKLIDLYVAEVGRHLPLKQRADIETELRSALEDAVEDEAHTQNRPADEALAAEVLRRYGPPEKTAASYLPPRYLVGPELFPRYVKVLASLSLLLVPPPRAPCGPRRPSRPAQPGRLGDARLPAPLGLVGWPGLLLGRCSPAPPRPVL